MSDCVIPARPHRAQDGLLLCGIHMDELAEWLVDVENETLELSPVPSMQAHRPGGGRGGTLKSHRSNTRLEVVALSDRRRVPDDEVTDPAGLDVTLSVFDVLHRAAAQVRADRRLVHQGRLTVHSERLLLTRQLSWVAAQDWVADLHAAVGTLRWQLMAANGTAGPAPLPGACPRPSRVDADAECGGRLRPVIPEQGERRGGQPTAVQCERDRGHRWEGADLARLAQVVRADG